MVRRGAVAARFCQADGPLEACLHEEREKVDRDEKLSWMHLMRQLSNPSPRLQEFLEMRAAGGGDDSSTNRHPVGIYEVGPEGTPSKSSHVSSTLSRVSQTVVRIY